MKTPERETLPDDGPRRRSLDPEHSFIVQAPAGSGKTGLLIHRYLALLARVEHPEEVLAITFTRKATGEMRDRVMAALQAAAVPYGAQGAEFGAEMGAAKVGSTSEGGWISGAGASHEGQTSLLARAVLERDHECGWNLLAQPHRLRIVTIDALSTQLARGLPVRSGFNRRSRLLDDASMRYREAARAVVESVEGNVPWAPALERLLGHLDNDQIRCERLLAQMLGRRDQWLRLGPAGIESMPSRAGLEAALQRMIAGELGRLRAGIPSELESDLITVCADAGAHRARRLGNGSGLGWAGRRRLPEPDAASLPMWREMADILQTKGGRWRARFAMQGSPPQPRDRYASMKARARRLSAALATQEEFRRRLHATRSLPVPGYEDAQWSVLEALLEVLRVAAGMLRVVLGERGEADFIEAGRSALLALGDADAPTDLALALDYRLRHILVDEFQDTSHTQYELLALLTAGWGPGDGRTLFLVGDPMQSIYRFREADVGLFLHVWDHGMPDVRLERLRLRTNFRSTPGVVEWVNETFAPVFSRAEDYPSSVIDYAPGQSMRPDLSGSSVHLHAMPKGDRQAEARTTARLVRAAREHDPTGTVALLVRSRSHLPELLVALREAGIVYRGVDIEPIADVPAVQDLLALTRLLLHRRDRVAWLAALRAPWCGLTLCDLHALVSLHQHGDIADLLDRGSDSADFADSADLAALAGVSADGVVRFARFAAAVRPALTRNGRTPLRRRIRCLWEALGGPVTVPNQDLGAVDTYLGAIEGLEEHGQVLDPDTIAQRIATLYATPIAEPQAGVIEVMTIHKAKGLEFDTVILAGLDRTTRRDPGRLLEWTRRASGPMVGDLLLAPIPSLVDGSPPPLYQFIRRIEAGNSHAELARMLYVAATRARRRLELVACVRRDDAGEPCPPPHGSLLAVIWDSVRPQIESEIESDIASGEIAAPGAPLAGSGTAIEGLGTASILRVPSDWRVPDPPAPVSWREGRAERPEGCSFPRIEFEWAGEVARHVGTVVHRALSRMSREDLDRLAGEHLERLRRGWRSQLRGLGVPRADLDSVVGRVERALVSLRRDERAGWLFSTEHTEVQTELALTGIQEGRIVAVIIDRTFVDKGGTRWIVDYKTGWHAGGDLIGFFDREEARYRPQLDQYAEIMIGRDPRPIHCGLYFPMLQGWREWASDRRLRTAENR